jgi:HAD superfamily hydrolase (TIGR01549 family)
MPIRGVVFDMDGTLVSQELDYDAIRREIGLPTAMPLLEGLERLDPEQRREAERILDRHESDAAERTTVIAGVMEFLRWLEERQMRKAVLTRNSRRSAERVLNRHGLTFDPILTREDSAPKPKPDGIWQICKAWQMAPTEVLMIGDYLFDIEAGRNAGTKTALVTHGKDWPFAHLADRTFPNFHELPNSWDKWFEEF